MTPQERVLSALDGSRPDRMPVFDCFWPEFRDKWIREMGLNDDAYPEDYYGIDIEICVPDESPYPSWRQTLREDGREKIERDGYGRTARSREGAHFREYLEHTIQTPEDLDRHPFDPVANDTRYQEFLGVVGRNRQKRCCFCKVGGPYLRTSFLRGTTAFLMDIASDTEFAKAIATRMGDFLTAIGLESLKRSDLYDTGIWIYDDLAYNDNPMFSPKVFEEIFLPIYRKMVWSFKGAGARRVILHSDGNIAPLLDMLVDAGIDGINPVEPKAGLDVVTLKRQYGDHLAFVGGMCNARVLPGESIEEITRETLRIVEAGSDGGIVIGSHSIGEDVPVENYECYLHTVRLEGRFDGGSPESLDARSDNG